VGSNARQQLETLPLSPAPVWTATPELSVPAYRAAFDRGTAFTIGVEEELMLVAPDTLELAPMIGEVLPKLNGDERFVAELRPAQLEVVSRVCLTAADACRELGAARRDLVAAIGERWRLLACGTHPFSVSWGEITAGERYKQIADEYTWAASRSLACGLHIHVAVGSAERALPVYNALRSYLPELAALSSNSPFVEGRDTGMSSIRAKLNEAFPRSGVPPAFRTWEHLVDFTAWGRRGGLFPDATHFWWELRLHPRHGTIEFRVADTQTRLEDTAALAAVTQALVIWLAERLEAGEELPVHETAKISENAWRAYRHGVTGWLVDLDTGAPQPTRERLAALLDSLEPYADRYDGLAHLTAARALVAGNGADRQRYVRRRSDVHELTRWLVDETESSAFDG
jgi:carboxylate-amine ligase